MGIPNVEDPTFRWLVSAHPRRVLDEVPTSRYRTFISCNG
jgi:hypothetical protein